MLYHPGAGAPGSGEWRRGGLEKHFDHFQERTAGVRRNCARDGNLLRRRKGQGADMERGHGTGVKASGQNCFCEKGIKNVKYGKIIEIWRYLC